MDGVQTDVAQQLDLQGAVPDISIPIYGVFFMKIQTGEHCRELATNIREYTEIRRMCKYCGAVCIKINVGDIDLLTLMGVMCVFTPRTGMNVFQRLGGPALDALQDGDAAVILQAAGMPIPEFMEDLPGLVMQALDMLFDMLIDRLADNLDQYGITLHQWEEFNDYYNEVLQSGEMEAMAQIRRSLCLPEF